MKWQQEKNIYKLQYLQFANIVKLRWISCGNGEIAYER